MKVSKEDTSAAAIEPAFSSEFSSKLPSEADLRNAALDPMASEFTDDTEDPFFANRMQGDAVALGQAAQVLAVNGGFAGFESLGKKPRNQVLKAVGQAAYNSDSLVCELFDGAPSVIDGVASALGSVPFVGAAAVVIFEAVKWVYEFATFEEKRPPLYQMSKRKDEDQTVRALQMLSTPGTNWTRLFLPRGRPAALGSSALPGDVDPYNPEPGGWQELFADNGMEFYRPLSWTDENGEPKANVPEPFGCAPGSLVYVDDGVQSRITAGDVSLPDGKTPRYVDALRAGANRDAILSLVFSRGAWLPSLSALARSVWAVAGQSSSTTMYNLQAGQIEREWQRFEDGMVEWRNFLRSVHGNDYRVRMPEFGEQERRKHIATFLSRVGAAHHDRFNVAEPQHMEVTVLGRKTNGGATVGKRAVEHARQLRERQLAGLKTTLNALVSADAPAFAASPTLRATLLEERTKLLDAGRFDNVLLSEVPDPGLRDRIRARQPELSPERRESKRELEAWLIRKSIPTPLGFDELGQWDGGRGEGGGAVAAAIGLGLFLFA